MTERTKRYKLGFSGTRKGMSTLQVAVVTRFIEHESIFIETGHHGDCIGSDYNFHQLCQMFGIKIIVHPPENPNYRSYSQGFVELKESKSYLERDRDIVDECDRLLATPTGYIEQPRSGTWYTINYARSQDKPIIIVWPDGAVNMEGKWND